jgi:hypothetical protein
MAEIKSAIQLAMERTQGLVMDEKEKQSMAEKELASNVLSLFRRYRENLADDVEAEEQLDALKCGTDTKKRIVLDLLGDEFESAEDVSSLDKLFSFVRFVIDERSYRELKQIERSFADELEKERSGIKSRILKDLAASGIKGDSVDPNVEAWPKWLEASMEIRRSFKRQIDEWKDKTRGS